MQTRGKAKASERETATTSPSGEESEVETLGFLPQDAENRYRLLLSAILDDEPKEDLPPKLLGLSTLLNSMGNLNIATSTSSTGIRASFEKLLRTQAPLPFDARNPALIRSPAWTLCYMYERNQLTEPKLRDEYNNFGKAMISYKTALEESLTPRAQEGGYVNQWAERRIKNYLKKYQRFAIAFARANITTVAACDEWTAEYLSDFNELQDLAKNLVWDFIGKEEGRGAQQVFMNTLSLNHHLFPPEQGQGVKAAQTYLRAQALTRHNGGGYGGYGRNQKMPRHQHNQHAGAGKNNWRRQQHRQQQQRQVVPSQQEE